MLEGPVGSILEPFNAGDFITAVRQLV